MKFTYIVSWSITVMAYLPCKSPPVELRGMTNFICSESDQKTFSIGFANRDSAMLVYKRALNNEIRGVRFDSIRNNSH